MANKQYISTLINQGSLRTLWTATSKGLFSSQFTEFIKYKQTAVLKVSFRLNGYLLIYGLINSRQIGL